MTKSRLFIIIATLAVAIVVAGIIILPRIVAKVDSIGASVEDIVLTYESSTREPFYRIVAGPANAWLLPCKGGYLLIDTGYPADYDRFVAGLSHAGIGIDMIRFLFVTHAHDEHAGFAARLRRETGCRLILPRKSLAGLASGRFDWTGVSVNAPIDALGKMYDAIKVRDFGFEPIVPMAGDIVLDADSAAGLPATLGVEGRFLPTPGHSQDSWSFVAADGRAFVGDAAMNFLQAFGSGYRPIFMEDRREVYLSFEALARAGASTIYTGHGDPFPVASLPAYADEAPRGPGLVGLFRYLLSLLPGVFLASLLIWLARKTGRLVRVGIYIIGFILVRDLMTPFGLWSIGSSPVLWLRFAADAPTLLVIAAASLGISISLMAFEKGRGQRFEWFLGRPHVSIGAGLAGALMAAGPILLLSIGILPGERGGVFPLDLVPALLAATLCGNLLEELLFRGYLQDELVTQGMSPRTSAVASGLSFGLCHAFLAFTVTSIGIPLLLFAVWEGSICGLLRWRFGLAAAVAAHGLAVALLVLA